MINIDIHKLNIELHLIPTMVSKKVIILTI